MNGTICYRKVLDDAGEWVEFPEYRIDGIVVSEVFFRERFPDHAILPGQDLGVPSTAGWPMKSDAMSVNPRSLDVARKRDREVGAPPTEYTKVGQPIFVSERHKRAFVRAHGCHDRNSYS